MSGEQPHEFGTYPFQRGGQKKSTASVLRSVDTPSVRTASPATPSPYDLANSIQDGAAEVAIIWMIHRLALTRKQRDEPLDQQIRNFSATAFDVIVTRFPTLRDAKKQHLWLIYFKGLLAAATPTREQVLEAIRTVRMEDEPAPARRRSPASHRVKLTAVPKAPSSPSETSDHSALEQISRALGAPSIDSD